MNKKLLFTLFASLTLGLTSCSKPKELDSISLKGDYQISFNINETFNHNGLIVEAYYKDNSSQVVNNYDISSPDMSKEGIQDVIVSYTEKNITKTNSYAILISDGETEECEKERQKALSNIREEFDKLDYHEYAHAVWLDLVNKLNNSTALLKIADNKEQIQLIEEDAVNFFKNTKTMSELRQNTWFDNGSGNYEFIEDEEHHLVITYDGYPGSWVYVGTKNLDTDITKNNILKLKFRNEINEEIKVRLQVADSGTIYKVGTSIVTIGANETRTFEIRYEFNVSRLFFFLDSVDNTPHQRKGKVTILETSLGYEYKEITKIDKKVIEVNKAPGSEATYTLTSEDQPMNIERVDTLFKVNYNGNGDGLKWFGMVVKAGKNSGQFNEHVTLVSKTVDYSIVQANLPIDEGSKLSAGNTITAAIGWQAAGLSFEILSYTLYYGWFVKQEKQVIEVNKDIFVNQSSSGVGGASINYQATIGPVKKIEVSFTTINNASYTDSKIYFQGYPCTSYPSGEQNLISINSIMGKSNPCEVTGTITLYPVSDVTSTSISIDCWWSSATYVRVNSVTIYSEVR